jgi:hypothetical protein
MLSSITPLLYFTSLLPIIRVIKEISFLLIVESLFYQQEMKRHHRYRLDDLCGRPSPATYRDKNKCQGSKQKKTQAPSTQGSIVRTSTTCPPTFLFGTESITTNHTIHSDNGQHPPAAFNFSTAAASCHAQAKRVSRMPATEPPKWSSNTASCATGNG